MATEIIAFGLLSIIGIVVAYESFRAGGDAKTIRFGALCFAGLLGGAGLGSYSLLMLALAIG